MIIEALYIFFAILAAVLAIFFMMLALFLPLHIAQYLDEMDSRLSPWVVCLGLYVIEALIVSFALAYFH